VLALAVQLRLLQTLSTQRSEPAQRKGPGRVPAMHCCTALVSRSGVPLASAILAAHGSGIKAGHGCWMHSGELAVRLRGFSAAAESEPGNQLATNDDTP
jgi:hypothetical protein